MAFATACLGSRGFVRAPVLLCMQSRELGLRLRSFASGGFSLQLKLAACFRVSSGADGQDATGLERYATIRKRVEQFTVVADQDADAAKAS